MARKSGGSDGDNSARIKIMYFEAENVSSDLTSMIQAFTNAVRSAPTHTLPTPPRQLEDRKVKASNGTEANEVDEEDESVVVIAGEAAAPQRRSGASRSAFKGSIIHDINWEGDSVSLEQFVKAKSPQTAIKRYLVIATWFLRHGGRDSVTSNLIYNAYRILGWTSLVDFGQPLREGARSRNGYFTSDAKGEYKITQVGTKAVDKMGSEAAAGED